jgi:hypothetical protein
MLCDSAPFGRGSERLLKRQSTSGLGYIPVSATMKNGDRHEWHLDKAILAANHELHMWHDLWRPVGPGCQTGPDYCSSGHPKRRLAAGAPFDRTGGHSNLSSKCHSGQAPNF